MIKRQHDHHKKGVTLMHNRNIRSFRNSILMLLACCAFLSTSASAQDSLAKRIQAIEDRIAIEELITGVYPRALDSADWKLYASLFAKDGELVQGDQVVKGPAAIEAQFSGPRPAVPPQQEGTDQELRINKHVISNLTLTFESETRASASAYWETVITRGRTTTIAGAGHYKDLLVKEDGEWLFLRREIVNPLRATAAAN
jgi:hypothetical protein